MADKKTIFISYAHADIPDAGPQSPLDRLKVHLKPFLKQLGDTDVWDDNRIRTSQHWHREIQQSLANSTAAIILVGPNLLASDYVTKTELPILLHKAKQEGFRIYPILLAASAFADVEFLYPDPEIGPDRIKLSALQAANQPERTLDSMSPADANKCLYNLAKTISQDVQKTDAQPSPQRPNPAQPPTALHPVYADLIERVKSDGMLNTWETFRYDFLSQPPLVDGYRVVCMRYLIAAAERAIYPSDQPDFEAALKHYAAQLFNLMHVFAQHATPDGHGHLAGRAFYKDQGLNPTYEGDLRISQAWIEQCQKQFDNLAKAANWLSEEIRKSLDPNFLLLDGYFFGMTDRPTKYNPEEIQAIKQHYATENP